MNAIDTNVLLYSIDHTDSAKQSKAQALLNSMPSHQDLTFLLWQVICDQMASFGVGVTAADSHPPITQFMSRHFGICFQSKCPIPLFWTLLRTIPSGSACRIGTASSWALARMPEY